jgi:hypothetical protein
MKKYFVKAKYQLSMKVLQAKLALESRSGEGFVDTASASVRA